MRIRTTQTALAIAILFVSIATSGAGAGVLPDARVVAPVGFTMPVEGFATSEALSPDGSLLAVLSQDDSAIDVIVLGEHTRQVARLAVAWATSMAWTKDGLYVARGYSGNISRFTYGKDASGAPQFVTRPDIHVGGLLNGIAEDPATHRVIVARTANRQVDVLSDRTGTVSLRLSATGQPFAVGFAGKAIVATLYNSDHVDVWQGGATTPKRILTGPHPTQLLIDGSRIFVANADGHNVCLVDTNTWQVTRRFDLSVSPNQPPGQTPSGMALSDNHKQLYITESGFNDVAVVDISTGRVLVRIPTAWYPTAVIFVAGSTIDDDPRIKPQLFILSGKGLGPQANPGSEHDGISFGLVQHIVVDPRRFDEWSASVARNNRFGVAASPAAALPPIKHFVFIVKENKHFDEVFGDVPGADADPTLLLYGPKYTPNAHALAQSYTLFDNFMGNGDRSDFGHSWTTQGVANDYLERNVHTPDDAATNKDPRVPVSIWPTYRYGEDAIPVAAMNFDWFQNLSVLPRQPRANVSGVFGPRGELIDELRRKDVSFRVYGEQMTMLANGNIAPGLASHAGRAYPGAHIDFGVLDNVRARLFLEDVRAHGLAQYSYLTLPTDHTSGTDPGFYTPASYVASNDAALGQIIAGLSARPEWHDTVVFVTTDDPQGTGDHVNARRMPAFLVGPYARRSFIDHTQYSLVSVLRTVETLFGLDPLTIYDAAAPPMLDALAEQSEVSPYTAIASNIPMQKNPGKAKSMAFVLDGPGSVDIPNEEWSSVKGASSLAEHLAYLHNLGQSRMLAADPDDK